MKILWLSNKILTKTDSGNTGSWLFALANSINNIEIIEFGNLTNGNVKEISYTNVENFKQWVIPNKAKKNNGLPKSRYEQEIIKIIRNFKPDLIHVWGVEYYWGSVTQKLIKEFPVLIEIQGLIKEIAPLYGGELSFIEKFKCIGIKEIIKFDTIFNRTRNYKKWGEIEKEIISNHNYISTHSNWAEAKIKEINPNCIMYKNERILRTEFYDNKKWEFINAPIVFTSIGYPAPFKGLYTLIKAVEILKVKYSNIKLNIAGSFQFDGIRRDGYMYFLRKYIIKRNLSKNISFIGPQNGKEIVEILHKSSIGVFPSFVESYGLALAESMAVGIPIVAAYNGGYSYLGSDNENILFFPPGDYAMCAFQIEKIISNKDKSEFLSTNSRNISFMRNDSKKVLINQIEIYKDIIKRFNS